MTAALKALPDPRCEWVPPGDTLAPCGALASWWMKTHDFQDTDPNAVRLWLMCENCAYAVLVWAQKEHSERNGQYCRGCSSLITPMLGGFVIAHGELSKPKDDVFYDL